MSQGDRPHAGVLWLFCDMTLVTCMAALVKSQGSAYPAIQIVFIRSLVGLLCILPSGWKHRQAVFGTRHKLRHVLRVSCNALALTCNFTALTALPLALVSAIGFMRPMTVMIMAVLFLHETIGAVRWIATIVGFIGILIMLAPGSVPLSPALLAAFGSVIFGSLAVIQTRAMRGENTAVLMVFYTFGLSLFTAGPAIYFWSPVEPADWPMLIAIGLLAQLGQFCFLRAHQSAPAALLAPLGYLSIVFATFSGFVFFGEIPGLSTFAGVAVVLLALQGANWFERRRKGAHQERADANSHE